MKISVRQYAQLLYQVVREKTESDLEVALAKFSKLVSANNDQQKLKEIIAQFDKFCSGAECGLEVEITTARELSEEEKENWQEKIGGKARVVFLIDQSIKGGAIIRTGNDLIDGSLRARLENLKKSLG